MRGMKSVRGNLCRGWSWFWLTVCSFASMGVQAQDVIADFKAGPPNGVYAFMSSTPKTLPDLVKPGASGEVAKIVGHLFLPPGSGKVPAVLLMHGSGGIYGAMRRLLAETVRTRRILPYFR